VCDPKRQTLIVAAHPSLQTVPFRDVRLGPLDCVVERRGGSTYVRSPFPLAAYPDKITERLDYWAVHAPDRTMLAERGPNGEWRALGFAEFRTKVRSIAQALLRRGLSSDRPIAILSGNDLEHALLAHAAMYAGIPFAPISPSYSLVSSDFGKLKQIFKLLTPGLIFAADISKFEKAIDAVAPPDAELVSTRETPTRKTTNFQDLLETQETPEVDQAHASVGPDTVAKLLFTSGSTGTPKGVINTQRMLCSNQEQIGAAFEFLRDEPPVLCDWTPWNHTFGGNHDIGLVLYYGGSMYIDSGLPTTGRFAETVRNLRDISPTIYLNVPKGFELLVQHLDQDKALRESLFRRTRMMFYAGAGLSQHVWDELYRLEAETYGERIVMLTGLGSTETAPFAMVASPEICRSGVVGLPARGVETKLAPVDEKLECRFKGPNVTPGYWRQPELTEKVFDDEGFYRMGDALKWVDSSNPRKGLFFDGRVAEDFKLVTGTWVSVGPLRARIIQHCAPYVRDVVVAGRDRDDITILVFPDLEAAAKLAQGETEPARIVNHVDVRDRFHQLLEDVARMATGSASQIKRAVLLSDPPSADAHEVTDKGSINQRAVLDHRAELVEELYLDPPPAHVLVLRGKKYD
jgi:feruloyl-CoA synthase